MLENNANISKLIKIGKILFGEPSSLEMLPDQIGAMKYAPIVLRRAKVFFNLQECAMRKKNKFYAEKP